MTDNVRINNDEIVYSRNTISPAKKQTDNMQIGISSFVIKHRLFQ